MRGSLIVIFALMLVAVCALSAAIGYGIGQQDGIKWARSAMTLRVAAPGWRFYEHASADVWGNGGAVVGAGGLVTFPTSFWGSGGAGVSAIYPGERDRCDGYLIVQSRPK